MADSTTVQSGLATLGANGWTVIGPPTGVFGAVGVLTASQTAAVVASNAAGSTTPVVLWTDSSATALRAPNGSSTAITTTFAGLTDKTTVDIPGTNTPTANALALKAPLASPSFTGTVQTTGITIRDGCAVRFVYTVANLPAASSALEGAIAWVTNSTLGMVAGYGTAVAAGGVNKVPVSCNGTTWLIG